MKRCKLTDQEWELVHPIVPPRNATTGRPPSDPRVMLHGTFWILCTGALYRDLPDLFGP
ncbi:MAG: transposase [Planctomycetes bacterium]|nr:transposase [Planctomycetota bacterium]